MKDEQIKERVKERYGKIALTGNSENCCALTECCGEGCISEISPVQIAKKIGYDAKNWNLCLNPLFSEWDVVHL